MQSILNLSPETHITTTCENHPNRECLQLCDHCNRFLCGDCFGEAFNWPGRAFYYCFDDACETACRNHLKRTLWPLLLFVLMIVMYFYLGERTAWFWLVIAAMSLSQDVRLLLVYWRRQTRRKQMLATPQT